MKNQRGFAHILLILFLLAGLGVTVYLVLHQTNILPKASQGEPTTPITSFTLVPDANFVNIGNQMGVEIRVRSDIAAANLFTARLKFDKELLSVDKIEYSGTFVKNWVEQTYDNNVGTISLVGGVPNPGLQTTVPTQVHMATIYFKALKQGNANVSFADDSAILSNADNLNILTKKDPITLAVNPAPTRAPITGPGWVSPVSFDDPGNGWVYQSLAYDGDTGTWAGNSKQCNSNNPSTSMTDYLYLSTDPITSDKIRFYAHGGPGQGLVDTTDSRYGNVLTTSIDLYKDGAWVNVYEGSYEADKWVEKPFTAGTVTQARIRFICHNTAGSGGALLAEFAFWNAGAAAAPTSGSVPSPTPVATIAPTSIPTPTVTQAPVAAVPTPMPGKGDGNGDGKIDLQDLSILYSYFGDKPGFPSGIDMNSDGKITTADFGLMRNLLIQKGVIKG